MISVRTVLLQFLVAIALSGCATHELVMSKTLKPVAAGKDLDFSLSLFRARVQKGVLEVRGRVRRSDEDYTTSFDREIESAAALCASLAKSDVTFDSEWSVFELEVTNEYGSQWRWRTTRGYIKVRLDREGLLELRKRNVPASEYPRYWNLVLAYKAGPPNYVPYELPLPHNNSLQGQRT